MTTWFGRSMINWRFLRTLMLTFGASEFTTAQAEELYRKFHWEGSEHSTRKLLSAEEYIKKHQLTEVEQLSVRMNERLRTPNQFTDMSARNTISRAAKNEFPIERVRKGVYRFWTYEF